MSTLIPDNIYLLSWESLFRILKNYQIIFIICILVNRLKKKYIYFNDCMYVVTLICRISWFFVIRTYTYNIVAFGFLQVWAKSFHKYLYPYSFVTFLSVVCIFPRKYRVRSIMPVRTAVAATCVQFPINRRHTRGWHGVLWTFL